MKILCLDWGAYTQTDISDIFRQHHIISHTVSYCFADKNKDDFFLNRFMRFMEKDAYDAVFTVNYFPLVAEACHRKHIKYLSWSYDNPLNVTDLERTLAYETNYVFLFDRVQASFYQSKGFQNIYHLPLGVHSKRLSAVTLSPQERQLYHSDVSFVGSLYPSEFTSLLTPLKEYDQGYLEALAQSQLHLYGCNILEELLTEELICSLNKQYKEKETNLQIQKEQLAYALSTHITRQERLILLSILSRHHHVTVYSRTREGLPENVRFCGTAAYLIQMPKVFMSASINLNITLKLIQSGIPLRALDIMGSGGFLLTNYQPEFLDYYIPGEDLIIYDSIEDAAVKAQYYLKHTAECHRIAQNGLHKTVEYFDYSRQIHTILKTAGLL